MHIPSLLSYATLLLALPAAVRDAVADLGRDGALTPAVEAQVAAVERAISVAASLAAMYLEFGWTVELCARDCHVPAGHGRHHEARIARAPATPVTRSSPHRRMGVTPRR